VPVGMVLERVSTCEPPMCREIENVPLRTLKSSKFDAQNSQI
jgi:hypothetical protein